MKPHIHAESSAKQFGGKPEDYLPIHELMDSSMLLERIFGSTITNSDGKKVSVRDIGEQHVLEDYRGKFIPSGQDWIQHVEYADWMNNGNGEPASVKPAQKPTLQGPIQIIPGVTGVPFPAPTPSVPLDDRTYDGNKWPKGPSDWPPGPRIVD
jgi:hypothetical protein